ncbi:Protein EDS1B [Striga hermonthica]|uniref:Protein EDS1B n=1 Tax=Striga hermonthica TaxID=68872 RepID=A0A9N7RA60_STRHE|nr:Protein EDS1B [Striga hermonthica]
MMGNNRLGDIIGLKEEIIQRACKLSMKAHDKSPFKPFVVEKARGSTETFFAFPGSWAAGDWYGKNSFGDGKVDVSKFPSLKSVGYDEIALVNEAFSRRFEELLERTSLATEVEKAISDKKQIIFTGHSSGGSTAILASIWFFEKYIRFNRNNISPFCLTFGSPLVGSHIFSHALRRENWARFFINFLTKHDVVPRIMLTPLSQIEHGFTHVLEFLNPKSPYGSLDPNIASSFMLTVMRNSLSVASHAACYLKGCTNLLLETVANIVELSPYRPFGFFVFCTGNGKLVVLDNPDAVLQLLFFCLQLGPEEESSDFIRGMFGKHLVYEDELNESLNMQDVTYLANLVDVPLSSSAYDASAALNDLGLTTRARLCLRAAGELEKQKKENQKKIDSNKDTIKEALTRIQEYKTSCEIRKIGYYDAFKIQKDTVDFDANVKRLELTGIWDEIMEMIKRYELPDKFEARKEWIELGTMFRRLLEPLDIANYYRHLKNEDTGPYMVKGRPKRYRFTQRWREHAERMEIGLGSETTFWAEVEELRVKPYGLVKDEILRLEGKMGL